jgi:D-amino-acid oxidase
MADTYIILGAGVIGLTTALQLSSTHPQSKIIILATYFPGDLSISYCSPWAGANWLSVATDNGRQENWDLVTYEKFSALARQDKENGIRETGIQEMKIKSYFDEEKDNAGILSQVTGKVWYEKLTGLKWMGGEELGKKSWDGNKETVPKCGFEAGTFLVDVRVYLPWFVCRSVFSYFRCIFIILTVT